MTDFTNEQSNINSIPEQSADMGMNPPETPVAIQSSESVTQMPVTSASQPQGEEKKPFNKKPLVIGIIAVIIAIIVAMVLIVTLGGKDDEEKTNVNTTEQVDENQETTDDENEGLADGDEASDDDKTSDDDEDISDGDKTDGIVGNTEADTDNKDEEEEDIVPVKSDYTEVLDAFSEMMCGDLTNIEKVFPDVFWEVLAYTYSDELGQRVTKDEAVDLLIDDALASDDFYDSVTYVIREESEADEEAVEKMQDNLTDILIFDEIEQAYELKILWIVEDNGEKDEERELVYMVNAGGEWILMNDSYNCYLLDW